MNPFAEKCSKEADRIYDNVPRNEEPIETEIWMQAITNCLEEVKKGMPKRPREISLNGCSIESKLEVLSQQQQTHDLLLSWWQDNFEERGEK